MSTPKFARFYLALLLLLVSPHALRAQQQPADLKARYEKHEYRIPMRDGVKLFTSVYAPRDRSRPYPIMLSRTPYSVAPYGGDKYRDALGPSTLFSDEGFIFVYQDVRGRFMSEGQFVDVRPHNPDKRTPTDIDESSDTYDTIEWLVKNVPNNSGRVGVWGISYPGFYTSMGVIGAHPALKAASPQAPIADWFIGDDFHHNGALFLPHAFNFYNSFGRARPQPVSERPGPLVEHGTPDGYNFFLRMGPLRNSNEKYFKGQIAFWNELLAHPNYDEFWQARSVPQHLKGIRPAVMTVGGWFDAEDLFGALATYQAVERQNPGVYNVLVMGPWYHGGWARDDGDLLGDIRFGSKTSLFYRSEIELPFFLCHLKDRCDKKLPEAYVFETGANRWRAYGEWPPKGAAARDVYLRAGGALAFDAPADADAADAYESDPARPVPYINGTAIGMTREYMVEDQRFASRRTDVLTYQTEPLANDLTVAGPVTATLYVSTAATDADFVVKLIDVYPPDAPDNEPNPTGARMGEYQMLVRGEPMRARFRNSYSRPEPLEPNRVTKIEFTMPDVNHTFLKGHRLMVQVQSTWFPLVDRNPQKFVNIREARESDFTKATMRVHRSRAHASRVRLNVLR